MNYSDPSYFLNRELSWLGFNERVLEEALDKKSPALERIKFLAITASNLDEFFMVRVAGLKEQVEVGYNKKDPAGMTPSQQLEKISIQTHEMVRKQYNCLTKSIMPALAQEKIRFVCYSELSEEQKDIVKNRFEDIYYPVLTPLAVDQSRPFPLLSNKSLNLAVRLRNEEGEFFALVQVPSVLPRIIEVPNSNLEEKTFIMLEDVIIEFVDTLFKGHKVKAVSSFRITRNADLSIDEEEAEDLLIEIEKSIKKRKWGAPVRLELMQGADKSIKKFLIDMLEISDDGIYEVRGPLDLTVWMKFSFLEGYDHLRLAPMKPNPSQDFYDGRNIFEIIKEKDRLIHLPFESFDPVVKFVETAAADPDVLAIKQTLYRVSGNSPIVKALIKAAENGKQVTVLVELKARFDEENNIIWARKLEKSGCHVIYGLVGLKIHCKTLLIVRREDDGIRRYVHLGTGNYNDSTAKLYTDIGMFTCKESYGSDLSALYNLLTGYSRPPQWKKLAVAPESLRSFFLKWIDNEIRSANEGKEAKIICKMNSLVDPTIIQKLYEASVAGVKIFLIVRGICCLRSGIEGISDNIKVISIIGTFLEHSRIFYFKNKGNNKIFIGSADWMQRNLDRRVETIFPVEDLELKERIIELLDISLKDTEKARIQQNDGRYIRVDKRGKELIESQRVFHRLAREKIDQLDKEMEQ